ncbi:MAG: hypothetical protein A2745_03130 [Candidatus Harrisonbacteria bacterium RIFCSPHIGHO2_01_FULL_44_13]|uniref:UVR domain-containing protein n=1 Tax=Candidatus Harrisonbacteria bacterium RIFCSPLOWO2_01_FULL_44_18 TaxID=1798407 RepID=A0A1G1ZMN3_9BACT|nr:MAG: hypothetical protein A2745_03130 [Candidatus Harrisonbacteria bacterium RIFCSPHIGHO2_01_FULL_44_13]OGY65386.1 MAG: hypothetical protein A3A16_02980 [Candidatus Harrisonbacteria bacterium RIFCSPLOWO2_01_FULL_44_18]
MLWANFLHIYQPPTQKEIWVRRITAESYRKIFSGLLNIKRARLTLNINGILCELLDKFGGKDVLENIKRLLENGNLELTGSAKYHAFLPFLPESEIERQILLNEEVLNKYFGNDWKKGGFFSPEMAYSSKVVKVAAKLGYKWIIMDELGFPAGKKLSPNLIYKIKNIDDFSVFFRERNLSFTILSAQIGTVPTILRYLGPRLESNEYVITAMDGETFGHHRPGLEMLLFDLLNESKIEPAMVSDLLVKFGDIEKIEPRDSTWAVTKRDIKENTPFSRWKSEDNSIQQKQWQLTDLAIAVVNRSPADKEIRDLLDKALHSDQYWWASAKPWWSLEMMERGAYELKSVILKSSSAMPEEKSRAEELYKGIIYTGFEWQRSGLVDELSRKEDEEIRERLEEKEKLFITKEEYQQMIKTLEEQMHLAAKAEEYHRAAMIKDRIRELKEEMEKI